MKIGHKQISLHKIYLVEKFMIRLERCGSVEMEKALMFEVYASTREEE